MKTIEERVESLEKANRRWRWAATLLALTVTALAIVATAMAAAKPRNEASAVTRTRRLEILNDKDVVVAEIVGSESGEGQLRLFDVDGDEKICLKAINADFGNFLSILGPDGEQRIRISSVEKYVSFVLHDGGLVVVDKKKGLTTDMSGHSITITKALTLEELAPALAQETIPKSKRVTLGAFDDGGGFVQVHNPNGKIVAEMQSSKTNTGLIMAKDFDGNTKKSLSGN